MAKTIAALLALLSLQAFAQEPVKADSIREVQIETSRKSLKKLNSATANTTVMTSRELLKAACCNLAEAFETNPSIDVNFADALTGTKQIKMLGLTSPYLTISEENIPSVRGASQAYGMSFTPGTWIESIQVTKGAGSVVNGYESISGQINTELLKPMNDIPFFLNVYGSTDARFEANVHANHKFSNKWATSLFVHTNTRIAKNDMNHDHFLDNPIGRQFNVMNRWQYADAEKGWVGFFNWRILDDRKQTGQMDFNPDTDRFSTHHWGSQVNTQRLDLSGKIGYVFPDQPYQSIGWQNALGRHVQDSYFGRNGYDIAQTSYYSNLIFNSIIFNTMHKFATGLNFTYDRYGESVLVPGIARDFDRIDNGIGAFFEYTYDNTDNLSIVLGGRVDQHNRLGFFATPRLHVRYNPWKKTTLRASAGRGKRLANVFAENQSLLASSRVFSILDQDGKAYGLDPEIAWNYGISLHQQFSLFGQKADAGVDVYRTDFRNQAVVDTYASAQQALFYNLQGASYANSVQVDFNYEAVKHLNIRTAYKFYDIKTDYLSGLRERPLQARHRFFTNLEYATHIGEKGQRWKFDFTYNWVGVQALPNTSTNPAPDRLPDFAHAYHLMNAQITRTFSSIFELYLGGENIGNYRQPRAVLGAENPFGNTFDASVVYGPVFGQMYYAGLRFKIKNQK